MAEIVTHINQGQKYRVVIERAASTKGVLGYKVEANGDDIKIILEDIEILKVGIEDTAGITVSEVK